jgi:hypothetical protein
MEGTRVETKIRNVAVQAFPDSKMLERGFVARVGSAVIWYFCTKIEMGTVFLRYSLLSRHF